MKEFDLEQAADLWMVLDLDRASHAGVGDDASVETAVTAAASIAVQTLSENRAVGLTASARRLHLLQPDRGTRVEQKILHLLANVQADGSQPLAEVILGALPQLRRGMTLCIVTGSTQRDWVRALAGLRRRGVGTVVVLLDRASFVNRDDDDESRAELGAVRHALNEYDIEHHLVRAGDGLAEALGARSACMPESVRRYLHPREGWLSLALLLVMLLALTWSVQAAGWLEQLEFLMPVAFYAALAGAVLALLSLSVAVTLPVGALLGAGVVLWTVGGEYFTELGQLGRLWGSTATASASCGACSTRPTRTSCRRMPPALPC